MAIVINDQFNGATNTTLDPAVWRLEKGTLSGNAYYTGGEGALYAAATSNNTNWLAHHTRVYAQMKAQRSMDVTFDFRNVKTSGTGNIYGHVGILMSGESYSFNNGYMLTRTAGSTSVAVQKKVNGTTTNLTTLTMPNLLNRRWRLKYDMATSLLQVKHWDPTVAEPTAWTYQVTDTGGSSLMPNGVFAASAYNGGTGSTAYGYLYLDNVVVDAEPDVAHISFPASAADLISLSTPDATVTAVDNSNVSNPSEPVTIAVSSPDAAVFAQRNIDYQAGAVTVNVDASGMGVHAVKNVNIQAGTFPINVEAPGGQRITGSKVVVPNNDAHITSGAPDTNYSNADGVIINGNNGVPTALFDYSLAEGKENVFRLLYTFVLKQSNSASVAWNLHKITSPWDESTVTYNTRPTMVDTGVVLSGDMGTGSTYTFDVSAALGGHGFALAQRFIDEYHVISSSESNPQGYFTAYYEVNPVGVTVPAGVPATMTVDAGGHTGGIDQSVTVNPAAISINIDASGADVFATDSVAIAAQPVEVSITTPDVRGGDPNAVVSVDPMDITVLAPNGATGIGGKDVTVQAGLPAEITTTILEPSVSNITDVLIQAEAIGVRIKLVGFYNRDEDKWADYIEDSLTYPDNLERTGDYWFRFHDAAGSTTAVNETGGSGAVYNGSPTLRVEALDDRLAVGLDGIDDNVDLNMLTDEGDIPADIRHLPLGQSVELVFRTTSTGTLFDGNFFGLEVTDAGLRWAQTTSTQNGTETYWSEKFLDIESGKVNDGKWHHIVWLVNEGNGRNTLMVDGKVVWSRQAWNNWTPALPTRMGMKETSGINQYSGYSYIIDRPARPLRGDFMEFIVRQRENYGRDQALRSYYILNNHTLVDATVADTIVVSTPQGAKGRGNQKKMLVLWGNGETDDHNANVYNVFYSSWSGMRVPRGPGQPADYGTSPHLIYNLYDNEQRHLYPPLPADYKGYKVYYANMYEPGRYSSPGIVKATGEDYYYDNNSGEPRFIDINRDLNVDVDEFDVVHVMHWPGPNRQPYIASDNLPYFRDASENLYDRLRDDFKKSIRKAMDTHGISLWIAEGQQAIEFGIAKAWDVHGEPVRRPTNDNYAVDRDLEIGGPTAITVAGGTTKGIYDDTYYVRNRRIVSTMTGFSEKPTYYISESISWEGFDRLKAHASMYAHNLGYLPNGLAIGTEMTMKVGANWAGTQQYRGETFHYGLNPNGIIGTVIAKEELTRWEGKTEVANPNSEQVTTVLVERGTILEGKPVGGRIFVELMDNEWGNYTIRHTEDSKRYLNGSLVTSGTPSKWDFDDRRNKELFFYNSSSYFKGDFKIQGENIPVVDITDLPAEMMPYVGMNDRGLDWLAVKPNKAFGSVEVFATAVETTITTPTPAVQVVKHATVAAQPARIRIEMRKPVGIADPDVTINADAVTIDVVGGTYQTIIYAGVIEVGVETPEPTVIGEGEDFIMYLRNDNITLYLGEDN